MNDAAELTFANSTVIRTLVLTVLTLKDRGGLVDQLRTQQAVDRMLALTGANQLITVGGEAMITPPPEGGTCL
jgi:anti-anti-sigma regulatory factor